ncbi:MAG TPA: hypothetical protein VMV60_01035 [Thermoanaerobaculia bacterium]|nr:hypothetical protein [Thermoanaerobaculia bacterium]
MSRALRSLAEGPFAVPLATIDWLVSRENPGVRVVALRELLARPSKDPDVRRARQALVRDPFLRELLALTRARLTPSPAVPLERRYDGGMWLALFLTELGVDGSQPVLAHAADVLLARWEKTFVEIERGKVENLDASLFGAALRTLARTGHGADARVVGGAEEIARRARAGKGRTVKDLLLLGELPEKARTDAIRGAIAFLETRLVDFEIPGALAAGAAPELVKAGYPCGDETDLFEMLAALRAVRPSSAPVEPAVARALAAIVAKADHRARWKLERSRPERFPLAPERAGEPSRWVTLRALTILQHFRGLAVPKTSPSRRAQRK